MKCVVFRAGPHCLGLDVGSVAEVVRSRNLVPVPEMPDYIPGVVRLRGELLPVVDMRLRLGVTPEPKRERLVIVRSVMGRLGLLVDEVISITDLDESSFRRPPMVFRGLKRKFLRGLHGSDESVTMILEINEILSSDELILLEQAVAHAQGSAA